MARLERGLLIIWLSVTTFGFVVGTLSFRDWSKRVQENEHSQHIFQTITCWQLLQEDLIPDTGPIKELCDKSAVWAANHLQESK